MKSEASTSPEEVRQQCGGLSVDEAMELVDEVVVKGKDSYFATKVLGAEVRRLRAKLARVEALPVLLKAEASGIIEANKGNAQYTLGWRGASNTCIARLVIALTDPCHDEPPPPPAPASSDEQYNGY